MIKTDKQIKQIIGYHGTDQRVVDNIIKNGYNLSKEDEWFGSGVYFFETLKPIADGKYEAYNWAKLKKKFKKIAIFKVQIESERYLDLVENYNHKIYFHKTREKLFEIHKKNGLPKEEFRENIVFTCIKEEGEIDFIRAMTEGTKPVEFFTVLINRFQIQVCVSNLTCIKQNDLIESGG